MAKPKSNIIGAILVSLLISAVGLSLYLWYSHNDKLVTQEHAIEDCRDNGYAKISQMGLVPNGATEKDVVANCGTLETRIQNILEGYDADWFPVYVTGHLVTDCGDYSTGCVTSRHEGLAETFPGIVPPVMTISYTADYDHGLEHTVTHEYVHVLTSGEEGKYLEAHPEIWGNVDPLEGVADCGIDHFMPGSFKGGSYMASCSPEQTAIANAVITDTLIK